MLYVKLFTVINDSLAIICFFSGHFKYIIHNAFPVMLIITSRSLSFVKFLIIFSPNLYLHSKLLLSHELQHCINLLTLHNIGECKNLLINLIQIWPQYICYSMLLNPPCIIFVSITNFPSFEAINNNFLVISR